MKKLVIIDGKSVFYRGYYAMGHLSLRDGTPMGGVYGFAVIAMEIVKRVDPSKVVVAWDKAKTSIRKRKEIYADYKAGRVKPPDDFFLQIPFLRELVESLNWEFLECDDYEADDIIGTLAKQAREEKMEVVIVSSDLDMLQVVDEGVEMWRLMKGFSELVKVDVTAVEEKYGVLKQQFLDLKALKGDASDNIPGVPGIGEKTAVKLLNKYGDLAGIYARIEEIGGVVGKKLVAGKESALMSLELARIMLEAPVKLSEVREFLWDEERVARALEKLEFKNLLRKFDLEKYTFGDIKEEKLMEGDSYEGMLEWDVKGMMHRSKEVEQRVMKGEAFYDLGQGAFLLDSLMRNVGDFVAEAEKNYSSDDIKNKEYQRQKNEFKKVPKLEKLFLEIDLPLVPVLYKMEKWGMGISRQKFAEMEEEIGAEVVKLAKEVYEMVGYEFNLNSPSQLSKALFEDLGLSTKGIKKKQKFYSTGIKELVKLRGEHEVIGKIMEYREKSKLLSTYIVPLPKLADEEGRIHTTFTQNVTATGRLSSVAPNLQNIPVKTEEGRRIRGGFVADEGKVLVSADYAQFELRLVAVLAGDHDLVKDFNEGVDIHRKTAGEVFGVAMESVSERQRRAAKMINFGVLYGITAKGLSEATEMKFYEAKKFIERYFEVRGKIRRFMDETLKKAREEGFVETFYGRRRLTPDVKSTNFIVRAGAERAAMNMPIQGTAADLMKKAMIEIDRALPEGVKMICQVHDSLMVECEEGMAEQVGEILRNKMEGVAPELGIKLAVDVKVGRSWGEL